MSPIDPDIQSNEKSSERRREGLDTIMGDTTILDSSEEENQVVNDDLDDGPAVQEADFTTTTSTSTGDIDSTTSPEMLEDITTTQDQDMGLTHSIDYINY